MLYEAIRILIAAIFFFLGWLIIVRIKPKRKTGWIIGVAIVSFGLCIALTFVPIEQGIVTFSTPQQAYHYSRLYPVEVIVEGKETTLVIGKNQTSENPRIIPKVGDRWGVTYPLETTFEMNVFDGFLVTVFQYKDSDEYYISVEGAVEQIESIEDNIGSEFVRFDEQNQPRYFAYVPSLDQNYALTVNGLAIAISEGDQS